MCSCCGEDRPREDFSRYWNRSKGARVYSPRCKPCAASAGDYAKAAQMRKRDDFVRHLERLRRYDRRLEPHELGELTGMEPSKASAWARKLGYGDRVLWELVWTKRGMAPDYSWRAQHYGSSAWGTE